MLYFYSITSNEDEDMIQDTPLSANSNDEFNLEQYDQEDGL